ncbi:MAG: FG-GAP-like repeat-containing protein [Planctomycetaceae bacterium]
MDLNGDGYLDILSGSYSREDKDMAGLFQVLWGQEGNKFAKAKPLNGEDGEPLVLPGSGGTADVQRICTRPTAADLNGDGHLDLVVGNFGGTFFMFLGLGQGKFESTATGMVDADDSPLQVEMHSDPFLVDWDKDGDLDLLTGSAAGGAFLFENLGTKTQPKFGTRQTLLEPAGHSFEGSQLGDAHITKPQSSTRVYADDVNGDGKLDLLIGDMASINQLAEGVDKDGVEEKLAAWNKSSAKITARMDVLQDKLFGDPEKMEEVQRRMEAEYAQQAEQESEDVEEANKDESEDDAKASKLGEEFEKEYSEFQKVNKEFQKLYDARSKIIRLEMTGFVWVLYQK